MSADFEALEQFQGTLSAVNLSGRKLWTRSLKLRRRSLGVNSVAVRV